MFRVSLLDIQRASLVCREVASCVVLPGEEGEFSVLDFHQPIVSCLKEGVVKIDEKQPVPIKRGIARMEGNELFILVEQ
ncbi:MAG: hypothetical protein KKH11_01995 [Candidatus Omnitrophica bacterium]|nr:hypothetical protein [Candidatus Omnitrophota bacterium]MBU4141070.1 hypothetical protein [Candidatus Omnitrophota bacterium]